MFAAHSLQCVSDGEPYGGEHGCYEQVTGWAGYDATGESTGVGCVMGEIGKNGCMLQEVEWCMDM